uniref:Uncharacterized protein n=1 Tax=Sinocyclocheilus rhinocerous TaxID=307959 RepID=A0A673L985_9TELE
MTKAFLPQMKAKNHGDIVTVASTLGLFSTACVEVINLELKLVNMDQSPGTGLGTPALYCVQESMKAILADQQMICIPRLMYFAFLLLPWETNVATYRFMGGDKCMYSFIKTKQQVNGHVKSS